MGLLGPLVISPEGADFDAAALFLCICLEALAFLAEKVE